MRRISWTYKYSLGDITTASRSFSSAEDSATILAPASMSKFSLTLRFIFAAGSTKVLVYQL